MSDKHTLDDLVLAVPLSGQLPAAARPRRRSRNASDDYRGSQEGNVILAHDSGTLIMEQRQEWLDVLELDAEDHMKRWLGIINEVRLCFPFAIFVS